MSVIGETDSSAIRVFPSPKSTAMLHNSTVLHYSPIADPPIDYTIHVPKQCRAPNPIPWRNNVSKNHFRPHSLIEPSLYQPEPQKQYWPKRKVPLNTTSKQIAAPRRHTMQIAEAKQPTFTSRSTTMEENPVSRDRTPATDEEETALVLEDLDLVLEKELSFEQKSASNETIPNPPASTNKYKSGQSRSSNSVAEQKFTSLEKAKRISRNRSSTPIVPSMSDFLIEDLQSITNGANLHVVNEHRKAMVMKKYKEIERDIAEAKSLFTPDYFKESKFTALDIPTWKRDLLAKRYSQEKLALFEENAWKEFIEWKKLNAPSVNVNPPFQYYHL